VHYCVSFLVPTDTGNSRKDQMRRDQLPNPDTALLFRRTLFRPASPPQTTLRRHFTVNVIEASRCEFAPAACAGQCIGHRDHCAGACEAARGRRWEAEGDRTDGRRQSIGGPAERRWPLLKGAPWPKCRSRSFQITFYCPRFARRQKSVCGAEEKIRATGQFTSEAGLRSAWRECKSALCRTPHSRLNNYGITGGRMCPRDEHNSGTDVIC
jgi:hypothetical protein